MKKYTVISWYNIILKEARKIRSSATDTGIRKSHNPSTWESTKDLLEKASQGKAPREAVSHVVRKDLGGISLCIGVGQLPRSRQQSSDLKRNRNYGVIEETVKICQESEEYMFPGILFSMKQKSRARTERVHSYATY